METTDLALDTFARYAWLTIPVSLAIVMLTIRHSWAEAFTYSSILVIFESLAIIYLYDTDFQYVGIAGIIFLAPTLLFPPYLLGLIIKKMLK